MSELNESVKLQDPRAHGAKQLIIHFLLYDFTQEWREGAVLILFTPCTYSCHFLSLGFLIGIQGPVIPACLKQRWWQAHQGLVKANIIGFVSHL